MPRTFSLYLDAVRFSAAMLVFLWHSTQLHRYESLWFKLGHEAVIVFFVLSGLVIAFCAEEKEKNLLDFSIARAARVYSVAIPAILLTMILDYGSAVLMPEKYGMSYDYFAIRLIGSLLFTNELWFLSIQSFSNVPYWSINYEVWYYILFAIMTYVRAWRLPLFALACLVAGPKILVLAPCWWLGVWVYRSQALREMSAAVATVLFVVSLGAFWLYIELRVAWLGWDALEIALGQYWFRQFAFSRHFLTDFSLALIVATNFAAARVMLGGVRVPKGVLARAIRVLAGTTFALYLLHQPFLNFADALLRPLHLESRMLHLVGSASCLLVILFAGYRIEATKHLYQRLFRFLLSHVGVWIGRLAPGNS